TAWICCASVDGNRLRMNHRKATNRSGAYGSAVVPISSGRTRGRRTRKRNGIDIPGLEWTIERRRRAPRLCRCRQPKPKRDDSTRSRVVSAAVMTIMLVATELVARVSKVALAPGFAGFSRHLLALRRDDAQVLV